MKKKRLYNANKSLSKPDDKQKHHQFQKDLKVKLLEAQGSRWWNHWTLIMMTMASS